MKLCLFVNPSSTGLVIAIELKESGSWNFLPALGKRAGEEGLFAFHLTRRCFSFVLVTSALSQEGPREYILPRPRFGKSAEAWVLR